MLTRKNTNHTPGCPITALALVALLAFGARPQVSQAKEGPGGPTVTQPVEIFGSVATLDDSLHEPYTNRLTLTMLAGENAEELKFDVPAGKRLIVETISYRAATTVDQVVIFNVISRTMTSAPVLALVPKQVVTIAPSGLATFHRGTESVKIRIDGTEESDSELAISMFRYPSDADSASLDVSVWGYLVDL
jgi:hypothetical protein